jgi:hypothetical protein
MKTPPKKQLNAASTEMFIALEELLSVEAMDRLLKRKLNMPMITPLAKDALANARKAYLKAGGVFND